MDLHICLMYFSVTCYVLTIKLCNELDVVAHNCDPDTQEAGGGDSPRVQSHPGLHSKFKPRLSYIVGLCLNKQNKAKCVIKRMRKPSMTNFIQSKI